VSHRGLDMSPSESHDGWTPSPPGGYSLEEWELNIERDVLEQWPPPFSDYWVVYCDIDGFRRIVFDEQKRVKVAHTYWDIVKSLAWGLRHHRVLAAVDAVQASRDPKSANARQERRKSALELWRSRVRIFSDSIFVFLDRRAPTPDLEAAAYSLDGRFVADVAASVSRKLWAAGLPHRGGIAFGKCLVDSANSVFVGEAIVHAYETAQAQEWLGFAVHPGSAAHAADAFGGEPFLFTGSLPARTKGGVEWSVRQHVVPFPGALMELREGADVNRDRVVEGLLRAAAEADQSNAKIVSRYARTARVWLRQAPGVADDQAAVRLRDLAKGAPEVPPDLGGVEGTRTP
jgi:hypothetical protein